MEQPIRVMPDLRTAIEHRASEVRARVAAALARSGRSDPVTIVAVTKGFPAAMAVAAGALGLGDLGESRPQELRDKAPLVDVPIRWHFIGPLQRNKVKYVVGAAGLIHSLDSLRLAEAIDRQAARLDLVQRVLVQVNISGESSKRGCDPKELDELLRALDELPRIDVAGLMTMPPADPDPESARPHFSALARLSASLRTRGLLSSSAGALSIGMTQDFEVAFYEGATLIRVGTAIFGPRPKEPRP